MFTFGFSKDDSNSTKNEPINFQDVVALKWSESTEIKPEEVTKPENFDIRVISCGDMNIKYNNYNLKTNQNDDNNVLVNTEKSHSDLIPATYEGGLKIWECTFDLLNFINSEFVHLDNKKVLDLGCGVGIIGIFSSLKGATTVFQDYNVDVLKNVTIPSARLNNLNFEKCSFFSGDWKSFLALQITKNYEKFDVIFTSETIYNVDNYQKLLNIFQKLLKKTGVIYLAAKSHYFGVGGGLWHFTDALNNMEDIFDYTICWECSLGVKRAIIKIILK